MRALAVALLPVLGLLAGCGGLATRPLAPPPAPPRLDASALRISLVWSAPVDLDLRLAAPGTEASDLGADVATPERVVSTTRCTSVPSTPALGRLELVAFSDPAPGTYRVGVAFLDACGAGSDPVAYRVVVNTPARRYEALGALAPGDVEPAALVVTVPDAP